MDGAVVAVVGGGQLARMMAAPATALGIQLRVLVESEEASAALAVHDARVGAADDRDAVLALVDGADVLTFEHEHVPGPVLAAVEALGVPVRPSAGALLFAQDKLAMRRRLTQLGVPCPVWAPAPDAAAIASFLDTHGTAVVKTARGGYDGKGVRVVHDVAEVATWLAADGPGLVVEQAVPFTRELAVQVARRPSGQVEVWPVVQSTQRDGVCFEVVAPAPDLDPATAAQARAVGEHLAHELGVTGVLAVELFEVPDPAGGPPQVLVNELAMRPHNSGHWTIDGAVTSQFEQHLRAVADLRLGATTLRAPWSVMVNVLGTNLGALTDALDEVLADPGAKVHLYGKSIRPG
ncbi:MAG: 5-(carboxyamino)imidazole ribonucleotide synthase, partial [Micrococcales bacterium]|nr:5-(carboxyamino)imidazole ribonucleotide synthase [Micrococcales bacterium]